MAELLLFHSAYGRTSGFLQFAERLTAAGHVVHAPDLFDGATFADLDEGVAFASSLGTGAVVARGTAAAEGLPAALVYAGFSLGALPAQALAQSRPGAVGALLLGGGVPSAALGGSWPTRVPLQVHVSESDPWTPLDECRPLVEEAAAGELFVYPGSAHLFAHPGSPDFEPGSAGLLVDRVLAFLARVGPRGG